MSRQVHYNSNLKVQPDIISGACDGIGPQEAGAPTLQDPAVTTHCVPGAGGKGQGAGGNGQGACGKAQGTGGGKQEAGAGSEPGLLGEGGRVRVQGGSSGLSANAVSASSLLAEES